VKSRTRFATRLIMCEKPERSMHVKVGARHPHQVRVGISNEAWQCAYPKPLPYGNDLRLGVRGSGWNPCEAKLTLGGPVWTSLFHPKIYFDFVANEQPRKRDSAKHASKLV
jgi:hypothetical protein